MGRFIRLAISLVLICLVLTPALTVDAARVQSSGQKAPDYTVLDAYIKEQMDGLGIPGLALAVIQDGQVAHLRAFGAADPGGRPVTPQTPFNLGSISKSITALAVMQLVEAALIDLDAPVQEYLPWFELADKEASAAITIRHLLNQTSGISTKDGNRYWNSPAELEEVVRQTASVQLAQPVGTGFQYSNINYGIAGLIVEKVSGQPYADYVTEHVFEPLAMENSHSSRQAALADGLAESHYYLFGRVIQAEGPRPPSALPSGFLMASVEDLAHYALALLDDGLYEGASILSPGGIGELHNPAISTGEDSYYAMGWNIGPLAGTPAVWHDGDDGRNSGIIALMPERDSAIILLTNISGFEHLFQVNRLAEGVISILDGSPPASTAPLFPFRFLYWTILLVPLLQLLGIAFIWRRRERTRSWAVLLALVINLALVILILLLAQNVPFPLPSMLVFYPELGYGLILVIALGAGLFLVFAAMTIRSRRAHSV